VKTVASDGLRGPAGVGLAVGALAGFVALDLNLLSLVSYWGDKSFLVPASAAAGALLWLTPLRRFVGVAVALLALLWLAVAFTPLTRAMRDSLVRRDEVQAADAVFVFGSRIQLDGEPSSDAMSRLFRGLELVADGRAPRLVVSELPPPFPAYAPLARDWVGRFAPAVEVLSFGPIRNTHDEAVHLAALFRQRGWKRVLAVTSPTHTRRAAECLEKEGLDVVSVPAIETDFDVERLERPEDRRAAFRTIAHERLGLVVYRWRGWVAATSR
jgi:uncharacterized SAM-binding protein YcdF (DUF218 family)